MSEYSLPFEAGSIEMSEYSLQFVLDLAERLRNRRHGVVKRYFVKGGYGIITADDDGSENFVSFDDEDADAYLVEGQKVEFDTTWFKRKGQWIASSCKIGDGGGGEVTMQTGFFSSNQRNEGSKPAPSATLCLVIPNAKLLVSLNPMTAAKTCSCTENITVRIALHTYKKARR